MSSVKIGKVETPRVELGYPDLQSDAKPSQLSLHKHLPSGLEPNYPGYKSGASPTMLREKKACSKAGSYHLALT
jgi:hypothetical protein